jgi:hypothetical protein
MFIEPADLVVVDETLLWQQLELCKTLSMELRPILIILQLKEEYHQLKWALLKWMHKKSCFDFLIYTEMGDILHSEILKLFLATCR